jgi:acyl-homoserine-lactone acylase
MRNSRIRFAIALVGTLLFVTTSIAQDLAGLATIRRDRFGVPHIWAQTEEAAAFAHGYATAEDHLPELARLFLRARGEQASQFGPALLQEDIRVHQLGIWETARDHFQDLPPFMQSILNGYADGYNYYLNIHRSGLPNWVKPVTGVDVLAHCRAVLLLDFSLNLELLNEAEKQPIAQSTMWAIGHSHSKSGHGILLANPHLSWQGRILFHEVQLTVPGVLNISGATLIGFPVITIGFNDNLGWAHTVNSHHTDNLYLLNLKPGVDDSYLYDGKWLPLRSRTFEIAVKTDHGVETQKQTVWLSHYGPLVRIDGDHAYAFKSPNLDLVNFLTEYDEMAKARTLQEFQAALNMQQLPMFNVAYADRAGNIFYLDNGRFPVLPPGFDWTKPVSGTTSKTEWFSIYPIPALPQILNPPAGYIQNCNDAPWYANLEKQIDKSRFPPYLGGEDGIGWRGQMSLKLLDSPAPLTLEAVKHDKYDDHLLLADRLKDDLIASLQSHLNESPILAQARSILTAWDNRAAPDSRGAELFMRWWMQYRRAAKSVFHVPWSAAQPLTTPSGLGDPSAAAKVFARVSTEMKDELGSLNVPWGAIHRLRRGNMDLPLGGANSTLQNVTYTTTPDGKLIADGGDTYVLAVEFTEPPQAYSVLTYSESSDSTSRHYNDQSHLYVDKTFKPVWFSEKDIAANLERSYHPGGEQRLHAAGTAHQAGTISSVSGVLP